MLNSLIFDRSLHSLLQFLVPEVVSLAEDPAWRVRRHAAWNMRLVFRNLAGSERLLDAFLRLVEVRHICLPSYAVWASSPHLLSILPSLSPLPPVLCMCLFVWVTQTLIALCPSMFTPFCHPQDGNFRVRRACTETIADMSEALTPDLRAGIMLEVRIARAFFTQRVTCEPAHAL